MISAIQSHRAPPIAPSLAKIVDHKVRGVALSCFKRFVHWFLMTFSCFYPSYKKFYQAEVKRIAQLSSARVDQTRHHYFTNGVRLLDITATRRVSIDEFNRIIIGGHRLLMDNDNDPIGTPPLFEGHPNMTEVIVSDDPDNPGTIVFQITEELGGVMGRNHFWIEVDRHKLYRSYDSNELVHFPNRYLHFRPDPLRFEPFFQALLDYF